MTRNVYENCDKILSTKFEENVQGLSVERNQWFDVYLVFYCLKNDFHLNSPY